SDDGGGLTGATTNSKNLTVLDRHRACALLLPLQVCHLHRADVADNSSNNAEHSDEHDGARPIRSSRHRDGFLTVFSRLRNGPHERDKMAGRPQVAEYSRIRRRKLQVGSNGDRLQQGNPTRAPDSRIPTVWGTRETGFRV